MKLLLLLSLIVTSVTPAKAFEVVQEVLGIHESVHGVWVITYDIEDGKMVPANPPERFCRASATKVKLSGDIDAFQVDTVKLYKDKNGNFGNAISFTNNQLLMLVTEIKLKSGKKIYKLEILDCSDPDKPETTLHSVIRIER